MVLYDTTPYRPVSRFTRYSRISPVLFINIIFVLPIYYTPVWGNNEPLFQVAKIYKNKSRNIALSTLALTLLNSDGISVYVTTNFIRNLIVSVLFPRNDIFSIIFSLPQTKSNRFICHGLGLL